MRLTALVNLKQQLIDVFIGHVNPRDVTVIVDADEQCSALAVLEGAHILKDEWHQGLEIDLHEGFELVLPVLPKAHLFVVLIEGWRLKSMNNFDDGLALHQADSRKGRGVVHYGIYSTRA